ncbi:MAG: Ig-like domain-containing protein [Butyrivibrio sp.]|nr:Ig-like domain-containing protein [Butyrivibrio sp.]
MKKANSIIRRILAMGLSVALLVGFAPANVYAEGLTDPETPLVISEGAEESLDMEESDASSSAEASEPEVSGIESSDEPEGQTIDEEEGGAISNEDAAITDPEAATEADSEDEEAATEATGLLEDDEEDVLYESARSAGNLVASDSDSKFVYSGFTAEKGSSNYAAAVDGKWGYADASWRSAQYTDNNHTGQVGDYVSFHSDEPIKIDSYRLITAYDVATNSSFCNPRVCYFYGRLNENDEWTKLHETTYTNLSYAAPGTYSYDVIAPGTYKYFRYHIATVDQRAVQFNTGFDELQLSVTVDPSELELATIEGLKESYVYTGKAITPVYTVKSFDGKVLTEGVDYTQSISPVVVKDKGEYTLTITGIGNYKGQKSASFRVDAEAYLSYIADGASDGSWGDSPYPYLLDNRKDTKWGTRFDGTKYVEFHSAESIMPVSYCLTTGADTDKFPGRNPNSWKVLAKHTADDAEWTVLHEVNNDTVLQGVSGKDYYFDIDNNQYWQYFRFEVNAVKDGSDLQVADFKFHVVFDSSDISYGTITGIKTSYDYTGKNIAIDYVLTARDGTTLVKGTDYTETITPQPVKECGLYTLTLTGKGEYTGQKTVRFRVSTSRTSLSVVKNGDKVWFPWEGRFYDWGWKVISPEGDHTLPVSGDDQVLLTWGNVTGTGLNYKASEMLLKEQYTNSSYWVDEYNNFLPEYYAIDLTNVAETENYGEFGPAPLVDSRFFSLSALEADTLFKDNADRNTQTNNVGYWLRSKKSSYEIGFVDTNGAIQIQNTNMASTGHAVRPTFNLDLDRILYASPRLNGYDADATANRIIRLPENSSNEWRLTFIDNRLAGFEVAESAMAALPGATLHITYSGARGYGANENSHDWQISGLLYDKNGALVGYGRSDYITSKSGMVDFTLPDDLEAGVYSLYVFNQDYNAYKATYKNYASPPVEVTLNVMDESSIVVPEAKAGLKYTGEYQELITAGQAGDLTLLYALTAKGAAAPSDDVYSTAIPRAKDAGEYDIWVKILEYDTSFARVSAKIEKTDYTGVKTAVSFVPSYTEGNVEMVLLPELPEGAKYDQYGTVGGANPELINTNNGNWRPFVYSQWNKLSIPPITSQPEGTSATVTIPVTGARNYNDYKVVVTFLVINKKDAGLAIAGGDRTVTYGDDGFTLAATIKAEGTVPGELRWSSSNTSVAYINQNSGEVTIKGAGAANIKVSYESDTTIGEANITITVKQRAVTITQVTVSDKEYDGTTDAVIKSYGVVDGVLPNDRVVVDTTGRAKFADKNVGNWDVSFSGFSLGSNDAWKYTLSSQPKSVTASIKGRTITVSAVATDRAFNGDNTVELKNVTFGGIIESDNVSVDSSSMMGKMADANAGSNKSVMVTGLKLTGEDAGNYALPQSSDVTVNISKAPLATPGDITRSYPYTEKIKDSVDLSTLLPENAGTVTFNAPETSGNISYEEAPTVSGSILSYALNAGNGNKGGSITMTAQMQNYANVVLTVKVEQIALGLYEKAGKNQYELRASKNINQGKSFTLVPKFVDGTVINERVVWTSSNTDVATVTQDGNVTGIGGGETVITATSEQTPTLSASCHVYVAEPVTSVTLNTKKYSFGTGEIFDLSAQILPFTAAQEIKWSSSNKAVVIVCNENGDELSGTETVNKKITGKVYEVSALQPVKIKAVGSGSAKIIAEAVDGSGKKAECSFTVGNAVPDFTIISKGGATVLASGKTLAMSVDWGGKANTPKNTGLTWKVVKADGSDASSIATISAKGVLEGLTEGKVKVVATSTANAAKFAESQEITIYVPVKSAALNMTSATLSTAENSHPINLSVNVTSAVSGQDATGEIIGRPVTVTYALDPSYSDPKNKNYNKTQNYHKYIRVSETGQITADGVAMANDKVTSLSKLNILATVKGFNNYTKVLTCKVSVAGANPLKSLKLSKTSLSLGEGNTFALTATLNPVNADGDTGLIWSSDNPNVSVNENGVVTVNKYDADKTKATITVKTRQEVPGGKNKPNKALIATCKVTVIPSVTEVGFTNVKATVNRLIIGKTFTVKTAFNSSVIGKKASTTLVWSSSDESVATVSQKGVVKAVGNGVATITARSADAKKTGAAVPSTSTKFEVYTPVTKVALDRTKFTIGTQAGCQYGKVSVATLLPAGVSDPSFEWKSNNENVKLAAVDKGLMPSTGTFVNAKGSGLTGVTKNATGTGVTVGGGQYLAVQGVTPGVVTLTGLPTDGSGKKVTCTVTVRGQVTGLRLKATAANVKANGSVAITSIVDIVGIHGDTTVKAEKTAYNAYKKYTDVSVSYRSSNTAIATVDKKGKVKVAKTAQAGDTVTIYVVTADGKNTAEFTITVVK